ncbi:MAG: hypothetical protein IPG50_05525 [Myxococcales bacterium]|nr:hypothetical protein [Myxococcales bacterium]
MARMNRKTLVPCLVMLTLAACGDADPTGGEGVEPAASPRPEAPAAPGAPAPSTNPPAPLPGKTSEPPPPPPPPADTSGLSAECVTIVQNPSTGSQKVGSLNLDTGVLVEGPAVNVLGGASTAGSLAVAGDKLLVCNGPASQPRIAAIDLITGAFQQSQLPCGAITANDAGLWLFRYPGTFKRFAGAAELFAQAPLAEFSVVQTLGRFGPGGAGKLLAAGGAGSEVFVLDPATTTATSLLLEGFTDRIFGISAAAGNRLAVASPANFGPGGVHVFDATTGKRLAHFEPTRTFLGLSCRKRP